MIYWCSSDQWAKQAFVIAEILARHRKRNHRLYIKNGCRWPPWCHPFVCAISFSNQTQRKGDVSEKSGDTGCSCSRDRSPPCFITVFNSNGDCNLLNKHNVVFSRMWNWTLRPWNHQEGVYWGHLRVFFPCRLFHSLTKEVPNCWSLLDSALQFKENP